MSCLPNVICIISGLGEKSKTVLIGDLLPSTSYAFTVKAESDAGMSTEYGLNIQTPAKRKLSFIYQIMKDQVCHCYRLNPFSISTFGENVDSSL